MIDSSWGARGFALPAVLIASLCMLAVLLAAFQVTTSSRVALDNQYYDQLAREAAESGVAYARSCIIKNNGETSWSALYPQTDCTVLAPSGTCAPENTTPDCSITKEPGVRTSFRVGPAVRDADGATVVSVEGYAYRVRTSNNQVWKVHTQALSAKTHLGSWKQLILGSTSMCGLTYDSIAYCWGANASGQLGDGTTTDRDTPTAVGGSLRFSSIASAGEANGYHRGNTCGLDTEGKAYCWGSNATGLHGDGTTDQHTLPVPVEGGRRYSKIALSAHNTCAIEQEGAMYCWGRGDGYRLGSDRPASRVPVLVPGGFKYKDLMVGSTTLCGLTTDRAVYCWGDNIASTANYGCTVGTATPPNLSCWGLDLLGKLSSPTRLATGNIPIESLAPGPDSLCMLDVASRAYCIGANFQGQLGDGTTTNRGVAVAVSGDRRYKKLAQNGFYGCGITDEDRVYCWGNNDRRQLGSGMSGSPMLTPVPLMSLQRFVDIQLESWYGCGSTDTGTVWCWGLNDGNPMGTGNPIEPLPVTVPRLGQRPPVFTFY